MDLTALSRGLRTLGDPLRIRILALLDGQEVRVSELTESLNVGQSRVSGHLARLAEDGLVEARRDGRHVLYRRHPSAPGLGPILDPLLAGFRGSPEARTDREALRTVVARREIGPPPGSLGRDYLPGRTWEGLARALLAVLPQHAIADLGVGSGDLTLLLAGAATRLVAVDRDPQVLAQARGKADRAGIANVDWREGDLCDPPLAPGEVDLWVLSQVLHLVETPGRALAAAERLLAPGGQVLVLDLLAHNEAWVEERLGHRRPGFTEQGLGDLLNAAGFEDVRIIRASRDRKPPHFVTLLGTGRKASRD